MSVSINGTGSITGIDQGFNVTTGSVGIGTDNPGHILDVYNSAGTDCLRLNVNGSAGGSNKQNAVRFSVDGDVKAHMGLAVDAGRLISGSIANDFCLKGLGSNNILFATNSSERARIDSSGRLLISGEAALTSTSLSHSLQVAAASNADGIAIIGRASDDISELSFYEADKTTNLGEIQYRQDHVNFRHRVGHMSFATGGVSERIRIKSNGVVQVANAAHGTDNGSRLLEVIGSGNSQAGFLVANNATSASGTCDITFAPSNKVAGAQIFCEAQEDFSTGANRTADLTFITRKDGTLAEKVRISSAGYVTKPYQPCAMAYNAQGQHMAGGSIAQFNSTRFNIGNMYNSSNGRMTVPVAGRYLVAYSGLHDYISQSAVGFDVRINGSAFNGGEGYQESNDISNSQLSKTLILSLSANDYVEIYIRQSGTQVHQRYGSFSMCLIT